MPTDTDTKELFDKRATELESLGFVFKISGDSVWYERGEVKVIPTLIMCASTREWNEFINRNSDNGYKKE